jgi:lipoprotein-releasing system ATP-binding protein
MNSTELYVSKITKYFSQPANRLDLFNELTITFSSNHTYAIMGASGSGKSTFMHILAGIERPSSGAIYCNKTDLLRMSPEEQRLFLNHTVGIVLQKPYLIRELSVLENIIVPGLIAQKDMAHCRNRALELLEAVGIADKAESQPVTLSGGQQHRVAIARALFNNPAFLLADEPTGSLDEQTAQATIDLLKKCSTEHNMGLIISTHDTTIAAQMETTYMLAQGTLTQLTN